MSERQNSSAYQQAGKYNPEAFRQFSLRSWTHNMECNETGISCGIRTLSNINALNATKFVDWVNGKSKASGDKEYLEKGYHYLFSDNKNGVGKDLASWIKKYKLGTILSTNWTKNPNSGVRIRVWIWRYNGKKVDTNATT